MKLLPFFLLLSLGAFGQVEAVKLPGITYNADSIGAKQIRHDTTKVLMLICDTGKTIQTGYKSGINFGYYTTNPPIVPDYTETIETFSPFAYWAHGYKVTELIQDVWQLRQVSETYLDDKKQPLKKSIVVWMTK